MKQFAQNVWIVLVITIIAAGFALPAFSATPPETPGHEFVGSKKCSMCHKKPDQGEQFKIWQESRHAKAFETLGTPEAKEVAQKMGVDDPQKSGKCLSCHATAYWFSEKQVTQAIPIEEGVSCESCHGPGKDYMKKAVMEKKEDAIKNGLLIADKATCEACHNQKSPTFKGFDFDKSWEQIKHPVPAKK